VTYRRAVVRSAGPIVSASVHQVASSLTLATSESERSAGVFDYQEFMNVMTSRGVDAQCPACGEDDWAHGDHLLGLQLVDENRNLKPTGGVAAAGFVCRNCGYLRLFVPIAVRGYGPAEDT
jgi:predicted RNA-binding Zn-ribbon protein involved in translation (DUF1610 family)